MMTEEDIRREAQEEFSKGVMQLAMDAIREANTLPAGPASEKENLDSIKHLIKRLAVHQVSLDASARKASKWLVILSVIMAVGAVFQVLSFFWGR
jgi:predicted GTPase